MLVLWILPLSAIWIFYFGIVPIQLGLIHTLNNTSKLTVLAGEGK
jgi:hypothetical protein